MDKINDILSAIPPSALSYQEWLNVGMALKHEGLPCSLWDSWSQADKRYVEGQCFRKWETFNGTSAPVTGGTILQYALDRGYRPSGHEIGWDDEIGRGKDDLQVIRNDGWLEQKEVPKPPRADKGVNELIRYLEALFESGENVGYVVESYQDEKGKYIPKNKGSYSRTAGQLIEELKKCQGDIGKVLGDYNQGAGAWIRFNPMDGKGVKNENVTEYKYALVESDTASIEQQYTILTELQLPIAMMVHSGSKSLHAIVRIDALSYDEYRKKVDFLYSVCQKNRLEVDKQNKNPSRLSRMPGVQRGNQQQYIVAENIGLKSFDEWKEYIESINDDLPDVDALSSYLNDLPPLADELIEGILREGHKMLIAGPSKAGKSYALIQLCIAVAEGTKWMGKQCQKGEVMYVNLELDKASCLHRFADVYKALGIPPQNAGAIDIWNLRGKSVPLDKLAPKLIRRALKKSYKMVVIDPIYKVITGDENSADQMANFCNQFDKICTDLGCATVYCHHHSKGSQGQKKSADRASGSGVFARDPDALLDLIELEIPEKTVDSIVQLKKRDAILGLLADVEGIEKEIGQDAMCSYIALQSYAIKVLSDQKYGELLDRLGTLEKAERQKTAWRIESTLREFAPIEPIKCFFSHPIHTLDTEGVLKDLTAEGEKKSIQAVQEARRISAKSAKESREEEFRNAVQNANMGEPPTPQEVAEYMDISLKTVYNKIKEFDFFLDKNDGKVREIQ